MMRADQIQTHVTSTHFKGDKLLSNRSRTNQRPLPLFHLDTAPPIRRVARGWQPGSGVRALPGLKTLLPTASLPTYGSSGFYVTF